MKSTRWVIIILALCIIGCTSKINYYSEITGSGDGLFRSISIGESAANIISKEKNQPENREDDNYLYYKYPLGEAQHYTLEFSLNEEGLYELQVEVFLSNPEEILKLYEQLKEFYTTKLGNPKNDDDNGVVVWEGASGNSNKTEVTLVEDNTNGELSISIIDNDFGIGLEL